MAKILLDEIIFYYGLANIVDEADIAELQTFSVDLDILYSRLA